MTKPNNNIGILGNPGNWKTLLSPWDIAAEYYVLRENEMQCTGDKSAINSCADWLNFCESDENTEISDRKSVIISWSYDIELQMTCL